MRLLVFVLIVLSSCTKNVLTEQPKTLQEFKSLLQMENIYHITSYTDTLGAPLSFNPVTDQDNQYMFEAVDKEKNGRIFNTTTQTICFAYWKAYEHPNGGIVFEWVDFDLTPTYYKVVDYNVQQGWFTIRGGNTILTYIR